MFTERKTNESAACCSSHDRNDRHGTNGRLLCISNKVHKKDSLKLQTKKVQKDEKKVNEGLDSLENSNKHSDNVQHQPDPCGGRFWPRPENVDSHYNDNSNETNSQFIVCIRNFWHLLS